MVQYYVPYILRDRNRPDVHLARYVDMKEPVSTQVDVEEMHEKIAAEENVHYSQILVLDWKRLD